MPESPSEAGPLSRITRGTQAGQRPARPCAARSFDELVPSPHSSPASHADGPSARRIGGRQYGGAPRRARAIEAVRDVDHLDEVADEFLERAAVDQKGRLTEAQAQRLTILESDAAVHR